MPIGPRQFGARFYNDIWNPADETAADDLLAEDLPFRGSLGSPQKVQFQFTSSCRRGRQKPQDRMIKGADRHAVGGVVRRLATA